MKGVNELLRFLHFLGLALGFSVSAANIVMGVVIAKAAPPEKPVLGRFPPLMSIVGKIGLGLLWATGFALAFTKWGGFANFPWTFGVKLLAVTLLTITTARIHGLERKVKAGDPSALPRITTLGKFATTFGLLALVFAVITFG